MKMVIAVINRAQMWPKYEIMLEFLKGLRYLNNGCPYYFRAYILHLGGKNSIFIMVIAFLR